MAHFADTNIAVYAFQAGPKAERALAVLAGSILSVQVLNEFANVCIRKLGYDRQTLELLISELRAQAATIEAIVETTHDLAREIVFRYELGFYDSALIASALLADCDTFYSEDMHHGLVIEDRLTIKNPFR
jgi:predicted nucleic acid-binding protein